jgi:hypothetical protein
MADKSAGGAITDAGGQWRAFLAGMRYDGRANDE